MKSTEEKVRAAALAMYVLTPELSMSGARDLARAALAAALAEDDDDWEWLVRSTVRSGPTAGRVIEDGPMNEGTARVIAGWNHGYDRLLLRRRPAGPWEPAPENTRSGS